MATIESTAVTAMTPDVLAERLAQSAPSAGALDELVCDRLSPTGRLDVLVAWERLVRHAHAGLIRCLGSLARYDGGGGEDRRLVESELTAALAWAPSTAQYRLGEAEALTRLFPDTVHLLSQGLVSLEQTRALAELTVGLDEHTARAVQERVLPRLAGRSLSATRQAVRRAIDHADPGAAAKRHKHERKRRQVELCPENDGMATLSFYLTADVAQMAWRTLTALAQNAKRTNSNDTRTLDQRRADLLPALLQGAVCGGAAPTATAARINVVVGIETLLGLSHEPGHLDGYGPICAEQTRHIANAHASRWRFLLTSTDGTLVDASPRTYTPTAAIKRLTELKHTTCVFPHCRMPANRCDLDHNQPFDKGGPTSADKPDSGLRQFFLRAEMQISATRHEQCDEQHITSKVRASRPSRSQRVMQADESQWAVVSKSGGSLRELPHADSPPPRMQE